MEHNYLFDGVAVLIILWFIKSYFLGRASTEEEKFYIVKHRDGFSISPAALSASPC